MKIDGDTNRRNSKMNEGWGNTVKYDFDIDSLNGEELLELDEILTNILVWECERDGDGDGDKIIDRIETMFSKLYHDYIKRHNYEPPHEGGYDADKAWMYAETKLVLSHIESLSDDTIYEYISGAHLTDEQQRVWDYCVSETETDNGSNYGYRATDRYDFGPWTKYESVKSENLIDTEYSYTKDTAKDKEYFKNKYEKKGYKNVCVKKVKSDTKGLPMYEIYGDKEVNESLNESNDEDMGYKLGKWLGARLLTGWTAMLNVDGAEESPYYDEYDQQFDGNFAQCLKKLKEYQNIIDRDGIDAYLALQSSHDEYFDGDYDNIIDKLYDRGYLYDDDMDESLNESKNTSLEEIKEYFDSLSDSRNLPDYSEWSLKELTDYYTKLIRMLKECKRRINEVTFKDEDDFMPLVYSIALALTSHYYNYDTYDFRDQFDSFGDGIMNIYDNFDKDTIQACIDDLNDEIEDIKSDPSYGGKPFPARPLRTSRSDYADWKKFTKFEESLNEDCNSYSYKGKTIINAGDYWFVKGFKEKFPTSDEAEEFVDDMKKDEGLEDKFRGPKPLASFDDVLKAKKNREKLYYYEDGVGNDDNPIPVVIAGRPNKFQIPLARLGVDEPYTFTIMDFRNLSRDKAGSLDKLANESLRINIRESLNKMDAESDNTYDLLNLYESKNLSRKQKKDIARMIYENYGLERIYNYLYEATEEEDELPVEDRIKELTNNFKNTNGSYVFEDGQDANKAVSILKSRGYEASQKRTQDNKYRVTAQKKNNNK